MNHIEQFNIEELKALKGVCVYSYIEMRKLPQEVEERMLADIFQIALVEINRELDARKIQAEGSKPWKEEK